MSKDNLGKKTDKSMWQAISIDRANPERQEVKIHIGIPWLCAMIGIFIGFVFLAIRA